METTSSTNNDRITGTSLWLSFLTAPAVVALGYLGGWQVATSDAVLLLCSIFVAVLLNKLEGRIPLTSICFAPRLIVVFWGILNLGVPGGVAVAVAASVSEFSDHRGRRMNWLRESASDVLCAAAAGAAFSFALAYASPGSALADDILVPTAVLAAAVAMLAVYQVSWLGAAWLMLGWGRHAGVSANESIRPVRHLPGQAMAAVSAVVMFAAFRHFGDGFGLVVLPLIVLANVAYEFHLRRLEQKTREIVDVSRVHLATVEALATAIDARDQVGVGHVRRTQIFAIGIGSVLGLSDPELNALRAGALLHDIGKLAVPEHILNKPGRLTSAELEKTKIHASVGASILERVGFPYPVVPTVLHHHEFWDGSGYPDGLSGESIPLTARILAVADTYDALRGHRPFRSAVSREDACNYLRSRAGSQFDPHVVNTFLRHLSKLEAEVEILGFGYEETAGQVHATGAGGPANYVEQIKRANQEVFSLYEMARDFGASLNLDETLALLTRKVSEFVPFETCLVYLMDEGETSATAAYVEGRNADVLRGKRIVAGEGATGYVLKKRKPVENVDPSLDFAFSHPSVCEHYVGMASVPLLAEDKLVGAISVFTGELAVYEEEHLRLLETISRIAADAICKSIKQAETEVHAQTDAITGLPNARGLQMQLEKELGRARRGGSTLQLLMLDLDRFKAVNDTFGHKAGDAMLKEIGRIIKGELRDYDFLARYGGDEFVALVPNMDSADVIELCSRIEAAVTSFVLPVDGCIASVGVSVGAASYPVNGETFEQLLIAADKAMYRTKAFHRQRLVRLGAGTPPDDLDRLLHNYAADDPPMEMPEYTKTEERDLIVELDESHIVVVNTIN